MDRVLIVLPNLISTNSRYVPYFLGFGVSMTVADAIAKVIVTAISMLIGAVVVHFTAPKIIKFIERLKKNKELKKLRETHSKKVGKD